MARPKTADEQIEQLFVVVQEKKEKIAKAEKPSWKTNCSFGYDTSQRINIQTVSDPDILALALGFLLEKEEKYNQATKILGLTTKFKWLGFSVEEWAADFKTRVTKIQITKEKAELESLESRLNGILSPEKKREMELREISKLLV